MRAASGYVGSPVDARTLLLGDWHPLMRDPIDLLRAVPVAGALAFLAAGDERAGAQLAVAAAICLAVRPIALPRPYDLAVVLAANLQFWGEALRLYDEIRWFDNLVHFTVPFLGAPVVYIVLARLDVAPDPRDETHARHYVGMFVTTLALGLAIGAVWEMVEYASDETLGSSLQIDNTDTVGDLFADGLGSLAGALLLVVWALYGWGSVRRVPGENRFEALD